MSTTIVASTTNADKDTTISGPFAFALDNVVQATITNPGVGLLTPCSVSLQLSLDSGVSWQSIDTQRAGMGGSAISIVTFSFIDYTSQPWTHARLVFSGNTSQARLPVTVSAIGDGGTWTGGGVTTTDLDSLATVVDATIFGVVDPSDTTMSPEGTNKKTTGQAVLDYITANFPDGSGTVTTISIVTANGVSGSVATATTTPAITLVLGAITPTSIGSATIATTQTASDNSTKIATTAFVAACTTVSASNIGTGTLAAARLPTIGLTIGQHISPITTDTDGATVTFDLAAADWHQVTLAGNRTLALSNAATGQVFYLKLIQDGTGSRTVTWFTTIKWAGGSAPTLTTTAAKADYFCFRCTGSGTYDAFVVGQNV